MQGCLTCLIIIFVSNFFSGYMASLTYSNIKEKFLLGNTTEVGDSISDEKINISIAMALQEKFGQDSLLITSIGQGLTTYDYYVSGVKGIKKLDDPTQRVKKVSFKKGSSQYRVLAFYSITDGTVAKFENNTDPNGNITSAAQQITPIIPQPTVQQDTVRTNPNNADIGNPTNNSDYDNNTDI